MRRLIVGSVLAAAATARAAPVVTPIATLATDLTGHGSSSDAIELGDDGMLHVRAGAASGDVQLGRGTRATLSVGPVQGKPAIVVQETTAGGTVGYIVVHDAQSWHVAWRSHDNELGPVGVDGEYSVVLAATSAGVLRYQTRPGIQRCDGKPVYLFAEQFDGRGFVRLRRLPADIDPAAPALVAKPDADPAAAPIGFHALWVSSQHGAADAGALGKPFEIDDGNPATAWHVDRDSDGDGQLVTFADNGNRTAVQLRIVPGDQAARRRAARPRQLAIVTKQGTWRVELPDAAREAPGTAYAVDLPLGITGCVDVVVASTYPGSEPLAIAELAVYVQGERGGNSDALLARDVADDAPDAHDDAARLARRGATAVPAIEAELAHKSDAAARRRLVAVLVAVHDRAAVPLLVRAAASAWVEGDDAIAVAHALGALGAVTELRDLAAHKDVADEVRIAAVAAIDGGTSEGASALVELAGVEPRALRHAVIDRLAAVPPAVLVTAAKAAPGATASADLWRAAVRAARAGSDADRAATLQALLAAWPAAADYERRYRLVDGIAALGSGADLTALAADIDKIAMPEATALRQVAAIAIGAAPRAEALDFVLAQLHNDDPGVRLTALKAFMQASDDRHPDPWTAAAGRIDRGAADALAGDGWPEVRKQAANVLGKRCVRPEPVRALDTAVLHDVDVGVRVEALRELADCHAPGTAELIARTFDDDKSPLELRTRAISIAILLGDRTLATTLVARFETWRGSALQSKEAVSLAVSAANAIGQLAAPGAAAALENALDDSAFPEIVGAAANALGTLGPACPASARAKLEELARSDDQQVKIPARRAARACGR